MDYLLTEEQQMIKDLCRQIAREKIAPLAIKYDEEGEFPARVRGFGSDQEALLILHPNAARHRNGTDPDLVLPPHPLRSPDVITHARSLASSEATVRP